MLANRAIVTITGKLPKVPGNPQLYKGVVELADSGFTTVEVVLPHGVKDFPVCPYMVTVDCETSFCEFRKGMIPLLTVTDWQPMEHYYM